MFIAFTCRIRTMCLFEIVAMHAPYEIQNMYHRQTTQAYNT